MEQLSYSGLIKLTLQACRLFDKKVIADPEWHRWDQLTWVEWHAQRPDGSWYLVAVNKGATPDIAERCRLTACMAGALMWHKQLPLNDSYGVGYRATGAMNNTRQGLLWAGWRDWCPNVTVTGAQHTRLSQLEYEAATLRSKYFYDKHIRFTWDIYEHFARDLEEVGL